MKMLAYWINCPSNRENPEIERSVLNRLESGKLQFKRKSTLVISKKVKRGGEEYEDYIFFATDVDGASYVAYCCDGREIEIPWGFSSVGTIISGNDRQG